MFFKSAVDPWVYVLVMILPALLMRAVVPQLVAVNSTVVILSIAAIAPMVIIPAWLLLVTYYRVDTVMLRIQSGPFSWSVPLEQIRSVSALRSFGASPSLSTNRLKIDYGHRRTISISPKRRAAFIESIGHQPAEILSSHRRHQPNPFSLGEHLSNL